MTMQEFLFAHSNKIIIRHEDTILVTYAQCRHNETESEIVFNQRRPCTTTTELTQNDAKKEFPLLEIFTRLPELRPCKSIFITNFFFVLCVCMKKI